MNVIEMMTTLAALLEVEPSPAAIVQAVHERLKARYAHDGEFFLLSLKHSRGRDVATWWRENGRGYTSSLADAGRYTVEELAANPHYNDGVAVVAIPIAAAIEAGLGGVPLKEAQALARKRMEAA